MSKVMDAIQALVPGAECSVRGEETINWQDDRTQPTQEEIDAEIAKQKIEYDAQEYARKREVEYPTIQELVVALYDTDDKSAIESKRAAVKAKYPKPS